MRSYLLIVAFAVAVPDRPDPTPKDLRAPHEQVFGDWVYRGAAKNDNPVPMNPTYMFRITASETLWITDGKPSPGNGLSAKIALDLTKNPITIDFLTRDGVTSLRGIMKLEGDWLTLAWTNGNSPRPLDFTPANSVHVFTRVRK